MARAWESSDGGVRLVENPCCGVWVWNRVAGWREFIEAYPDVAVRFWSLTAVSSEARIQQFLSEAKRTSEGDK